MVNPGVGVSNGCLNERMVAGSSVHAASSSPGTIVIVGGSRKCLVENPRNSQLLWDTL